MRRFTLISATVVAMLASPAQALPNAFWIFGFHLPGKGKPRHAAVTAVLSSDRVRSVDLDAGEVQRSQPLESHLSQADDGAGQHGTDALVPANFVSLN